FNTSKYIPVAFLSSEPNDQNQHDSKMPFWVQTNPRGAESLPSGIIASQSDFYLRRLWGHPDEDVMRKPKYLVTFTVGIDMKDNIDEAVKKFSDDFSIMLFHYDGKTSEWDQFEWSKRAIHVNVLKQTKWWYAKRFLHPDIVATYDYIFIWDEDLGVEHFDPVKYINLVKKYGLEISQPGLDPSSRRDSTEKVDWCKDPNAAQCIYFSKLSVLFRDNFEREGSCVDPSLPPCARYVAQIKNNVVRVVVIALEFKIDT
uniref:Uncharacterized protein n=1 Tax=Chenopodium quinoa TaxID=63459 RepID=A0A803M732_CHEQI